MPTKPEQQRVNKISKDYQKKGYSKKRADYIARATVFGKKKNGRER